MRPDRAIDGIDADGCAEGLRLLVAAERLIVYVITGEADPELLLDYALTMLVRADIELELAGVER